MFSLHKIVTPPKGEIILILTLEASYQFTREKWEVMIYIFIMIEQHTFGKGVRHPQFWSGHYFITDSM